MEAGAHWMMKWLGHRGILPGFAGLCLSALAAGPVGAKTHHHHHVTAPVATDTADSDPSAGFGPTSAGVSAILIDARTGAMLSGQGEDVPRYPASLTKLMTLDLAFQALAQGRMALDTQIPVSYHAQSVEPVKLGLVAGQTISVQNAILAMTTMSANDAATALGEYLGGGSEQRCAQLMTIHAHDLGMAQSQFANTSGLPNPNQVTTARDLSILARDIVVNYPQFQSFFEVTSFVYQGRDVYSNNRMLRTYAGTTGMKTGYTFLARHNLVTSASRNGQQLIGVVLHEPSWNTTYLHMTAMLDSGFGGAPVPAVTYASAAAPAQAKPPAQLAAAKTKTHAPGVPTVAQIAALQAKHGTASGGAKVASLPPPPPAAPVQRVASNAHTTALGGWVAQLGLYKHMSKARTAAIAARQVRGVGIARIAKVQHHGQTMWTAQLAGLSYHAAHETCSVMAAKGTSCHVLAPSADHLAMVAESTGEIN
jgi:D-alanyl-D-alanine carboxypeptidase